MRLSGNNGGRGFTIIELLVACAVVGVLVVLVIGMVGQSFVAANRVKCASNMRQIGTALLLYAGEHEGRFPPTTHSTAALGTKGRYQSWIYQLTDYIGEVDRVRVCPADRADRRKKITESDGLTSYTLNDLIFDAETEDSPYSRLQNIPSHGRTMILFNVSDDRPINRGWDHAHCGEWTSWYGVLADVEVDRHRVGGRSEDRMKGSANYLFLDGHVENIKARDLRKIVDSGINPGAVPSEMP